MPEALKAAAASDTSTSLREGLPLHFLDYMGVIHDDTNVDELPDGLRQRMDDSQKGSASEDAEDLKMTHRFETFKKLREEFREEAKKCIIRVSKEALSMLDAACHQIGKRFISD